MFVFRQNTDGNDVFSAIMACVYACLRDALEFLNKFAFTLVAITGCDFCKAARDTWGLIYNYTSTMLVYDHMVSLVCWHGCLLAALFSFVVGIIVAVGAHVSAKDAVTVGVVCFVCGLLAASAVMAVLDSMCSSLFVCYVHYPDEFSVSHPELADPFVKAWEERGQDMSVTMETQPLARSGENA